MISAPAISDCVPLVPIRSGGFARACAFGFGISRRAALLIPKSVRKQGVYRCESPNLTRAVELRRAVIVRKILKTISA